MRAYTIFYKDSGGLFLQDEIDNALARMSMFKIGDRLDVMVKPVAGRNDWLLTDLLGRPMGVIRADGSAFAVEPEGKARETMKGMRCGPFSSLDEALAAIETHTRGVCRRDPGTAQDPGADLVEPPTLA